ncbi:hypothetical protein GCM10017687_73990 [Streptomyces echinatus]
MTPGVTRPGDPLFQTPRISVSAQNTTVRLRHSIKRHTSTNRDTCQQRRINLPNTGNMLQLTLRVPSGSQERALATILDPYESPGHAPTAHTPVVTELGRAARLRERIQGTRAPGVPVPPGIGKAKRQLEAPQ